MTNNDEKSRLGFDASDIMILSAAALALFSLFLPWISVVTLPLARTWSADGFTQIACWIGLALFICPVFIVLQQKRTKGVIVGMLCAGTGLILGGVYLALWSKISLAQYIIAEKVKVVGNTVSLSNVFADITENKLSGDWTGLFFKNVMSEVNVAGIGAYVFIFACCVLTVGLVLRYNTVLVDTVSSIIEGFFVFIGATVGAVIIIAIIAAIVGAVKRLF